MVSKCAFSQDSDGQSQAWDTTSAAILVVSDFEAWQRQGWPVPTKRIDFVQFCDINEQMLSDCDPKVIYSPLMGDGFDCIELAMLLRNLGYVGVYRAIASDLPSPDLIEREVGQICPAIKFEIVIVDQPKADTND